ncbi:hypothetical protein D8M04_14745 [Oceanobacillus piezotolerans]|uniref:Uncharacterized protein n=1 Tax=Oceanobacillus piezotolerans TaxID=2448030 RepID=A0A498DK51_9BACI|nr:hypothetical protein [Oceanobacillus piezotolerans]RLL42805.1 hypothetical protein D8M04_14745 [Oceanobacillus piezotolerans]
MEKSITLWIKLIVIGIISGISLGLFLKLIEILTEEKVYTLLMNVDYIPLLKDYRLSELVEFSLHLIVSIALVIILYLCISRLDIHRKSTIYTIIISIIGIMLYFTTSFSERTPLVTDYLAFTYWVVGHLIYGIIVSKLLKLWVEKDR